MLTVICMIIFLVIVSQKSNKKKSPPPRTQTGTSNFEIPTLANDPNKYEENFSVITDTRNPVEYRPKKIESSVSEMFTQTSKPQESPKVNLDLTPSNVMNAIVMSEILDKPKALRRGRRRF
ncbi:MAG: hypothetical protein K6G55_07355 [Selenomonadaceae bacterium]|nr:hypothetical protein [Selenomonadaceae bacterium]